MAMNAGTTSMANGTMARALYDAFNSTFGAVTEEADTFRRQLCVAFATAIVAHIQEHAQANTDTGEIT
jgi:hypothetical protein